MFGRRKSVTDSLVGKDKEENDSKNNEKGPNAKFIFYDNENKFTKQIELYAVLNSSQVKVLLLISNEKSFDFLSMKIAESYEQYPQFKNLEGLKAINLTKRNEKQNNIKLPLEGSLEGLIINGDIIYFDFDTNEYWIKALINITVGHDDYNSLNISIDLKGKLSLEMKKFKLIILKYALNFWIDHMRNSQMECVNFIVGNVKFQTKSLGEFTFNPKSNEKIDTLKIKNVFDFKGEIKAKILLIPIEEIVFLSLKKITDLENFNDRKFKDFKELNFYTFLVSDKFASERKFIFQKVKKVLTSNTSERGKPLYFYNCNNSFNAQTSFNIDMTHSMIKSEDQSTLIPPIRSFLDDSSKSINSKERGRNVLIIPAQKEYFDRNFISKSIQSQGLVGSSINRKTKGLNRSFSTEQDLKSQDSSEEDADDTRRSIDALGKIKKNRNIMKPEKQVTLFEKIRDPSKFYNLCNEFQSRFDLNSFTEELCNKYKLVINKGILESIVLPEFRNFVIISDDQGTKRGTDLEEEEDNSIIWKNNILCLIFIVLLGTYFGFLLHYVLDIF